MRHLVKLAVLCVALLALDAWAATCDLVEFPASGTLTAERLNQRLRQTESCVNGALGDANISSSEPLALNKLQNTYGTFAVSWSVGDEDGDATAGEDVGTIANARQWQVPATSTVIGASVTLTCHGSPADCSTASVSVTLQEDSTTFKIFSGLNDESVHTDFGLSTSVSSTDVLNFDISGTTTNVKRVDVVFYLKTQHTN